MRRVDWSHFFESQIELESISNDLANPRSNNEVECLTFHIFDEERSDRKEYEAHSAPVRRLGIQVTRPFLTQAVWMPETYLYTG